VNRLRAGAANRFRTGGGDEGSALVEFLSAGVLLLVPLVYLVIVLGRVQAASLAADGAAREAARAVTTADTTQDADARAALAVRLALGDQGFADSDGAMVIDCGAGGCLVPGNRVEARVAVRVILPGVPRFVDRAVPASITVRAVQVAVVDEFRTRG
jgi:Flp pilus assembly protein TadG